MSFLASLRHAVANATLRRRLLLTLGLLLAYRVGAQLPAPGVNYDAIRSCADSLTDNTLVSTINLFSGGSLTQLSLLALGVMPYVTASILIQLLGVVIPRIGALKKEGATGQATLTQYTRYLTAGLALVQAAGLVFTASGTTSRLYPNCPAQIVDTTAFAGTATLVAALTVGALVAMWFGEQITEKGFGNGVSLILFASIAATLPAQMSSLVMSASTLTVILCVAGLTILLLAVVFVEQGQRRIPIAYGASASRHISYLPFKVNSASVVPVIYASSLLYTPTVISQFAGDSGPFTRWVAEYLASGHHPVYIAAYVALVIFFTFFQVAITIDTYDMADQLNAAGGFVPGIRPGDDTREYLTGVLSRLTAAGAVYLAVLATIPLFVLAGLGSSASQLPLGGTALLILVSVALETTKKFKATVAEHAPVESRLLAGSFQPSARATFLTAGLPTRSDTATQDSPSAAANTSAATDTNPASTPDAGPEPDASTQEDLR